VCVHAAFVAHKPRNLTFEQAAAVPVAGLTAYECVMRASALAAGKAVFIAGGSGGVGTMAIQLARLRGATSIAVTAGGDASARYLTEELEVSPNQIVRYHGRSREELVEAALKANGGQYYPVVIDCVGGAMTSLCCRVVDFDGHVVSIVAGPSDAAHAGAQSDEEQLFDRSATFHFELLYARARYGSPQTWPVYGRSLAELTRLFEAEQLRAPAVTDVGTLSVVSVEEALARLQEGHVQGKLVMVVGPTEPGDLS
jgi:NADPH:quinone reductase-like Zn-dependent oxidoreductase